MTARSEGWVAQTLRAMDDDVGLFDAWFQWSAHGAPAVEIDFLLRPGKRLIALEAKGGRRFRSDMLKGLAAIADLGGVERRLLVYGVSETGLAVAADRTAAYVTRCRVDGRKVIGLRDVRSDQGQHTDNRRLADATMRQRTAVTA